MIIAADNFYNTHLIDIQFYMFFQIKPAG